MNSEIYKKMMRLFQTHQKYIPLIIFINRYFTLFTFVSYPTLILWMFFAKDHRTAAFILVPALSFICLSIFRKIIHRPRPYEIYDIKPIIRREKNGDSFPSRHVFSIFLISGIWFPVFAPIGVLLFIFGICLGIIRVIGGVHFPSDVICGAILGIFCGFLTAIVSTF